MGNLHSDPEKELSTVQAAEVKICVKNLEPKPMQKISFAILFTRDKIWKFIINENNDFLW